MAEQQTEQLPDEEVVEGAPGYKPPAQKTLDEILTTDAEDESLKKYKESLLGKVDNISCVYPDDPRNVIVKSLVFEPTDAAKVVLDLTGDISKLKKQKFVIKEGCEYRLGVSFYVQREIVCGLRYIQTTSRKGIKVEKDTFMVGSYGPKGEIYTFYTPKEEAPKGMLTRGSYTVKSEFTDDDESKYLNWEWSFDIKKDWE